MADHTEGGRPKRPVLRLLDTGGLAGNASASPYAGDLQHMEDPRAVVVVNRGRIDEAADHSAEAVFSKGSPYYQRGETLVRLVHGTDAVKHRASSEVPLLVLASQSMLLDDLERSCRFIARSENADTGDVRARVVACPKPLPGVLLARAGRLPVPAIRGIAEVPLLHDDGSVTLEGYDARAKVVVVAPGNWPVLANDPTEQDARDALARVDAVIAGFPFVSDDDRAVTLAAMLSAVLRPTLPSCPAFAWSAPVAGSGKSKLADVAAVIATGRTASALTWPAQEEEAEKRLGASIMAGDAVLLLDNVEAALRGACLNSLLTQSVVSIRVLGRSQMLRLGAAVLILATGNNLVLHGDLNRRFLVATLDPHTERPELRRFTFDPVARALSERRLLVTALHTIARWGASQSTGLPPLGSFEEWSRRVRDPLVALGLPDCCRVLEQLHRDDPEREQAIALLSEWRGAFGPAPTTVAQAIRKSLNNPTLRDALDEVAGLAGGINARRLGNRMAKWCGRVFGDMVLRKDRDLTNKVVAWAVETAPSPGVTGVSGVMSNREVEKKESNKGLELTPDNPVTPGQTENARDAASYRTAKDGDNDCPF